MVGVGTKYHCSLNNTGYLLAPNGYSKKDAPVFAPRFGTGEQGLSDLDLFKTIAQTDMSAGGFQTLYDPQKPKFALVKNMIYNQYDKMLYTIPSASAAAITGNSIPTYGRKYATYKGVMYFIKNIAANGKVFKYNPSTKTDTSVKADFTASVTDIFVFNNLLFVLSSVAGGGVWTYDGTTWTSDNRYGFQTAVVLKKNIVASGSAGGSDGGKLWLRDGTAGTTAVVTQIDSAGDVNRTINSMVAFNSRAYIGKPDGLFVYDGVQVSQVLDTSSDADALNFGFMTSYNGILYYSYKNALWSFNSLIFSKVQDFASYETIQSVSAAGGRLWVSTLVSTAVYDQFAIGTANFYCWDGLGWYLYYSQATGLSTTGVMYCNDGTYDHFIFALFNAGSPYAASYDVVNKAAEFTAVASAVGSIYTPSIDGNFPNIDKYFDSVTPGYEKIIVNDSVEAQVKIISGAGDLTGQSSQAGGATAADDSAVGSLAWATPNNAKLDDGTLTSVTVPGAGDSGFKSPSAHPGPYITYDNWTNPANAYAADGAFATRLAATPGSAEDQTYQTFGFGIPAGAVVTGIDVKVKGKVDSGSGNLQMFLLFDRNNTGALDVTDLSVALATSLNATLDTTNTEQILSAASGIWPGAGLADGLFNLWISGATVGKTYSIDLLQVKVYYSYNTAVDNVVKLVKGGAVSGNNKADTATSWPASLNTAIYGGATDLWGLALTAADVNGATFGVVLSGNYASNLTHYLKLTNFGFAIPAAAVINGITVNIKRSVYGVDYISIVVTYTLPADTWLSVGTLTSASLMRKLYAFLLTATTVWRKIQLKFIITRSAASLLSFRDYSFNYYLAPDPSYQWQLRLICTGNTETPLKLLDDTNEVKTGAALRDAIYTARANDAPIGFEDIDFNYVSGTLGAGGDVTMDSTDALKSSGFVKIDNEIIRYSGKTSTSLTGCTRGVLGTAAVGHSDNAVVTAYYRVVIKSIDNETIAGDPPVPNQLATGQESYITLTLQEAPSG